MKEIIKAKVTCAGDSEDLSKIAKKKGIILPSEHLGAFKTVYARIEDANRNKVRLSRNAVVNALPSLIGSQVNINHWRENWTVGSIFWANVNDNNEIEIAFTFFKDIYQKEHDIAMALFDKGELTVSFELIANPDTVDFHSDGTRTLNNITFVGCGLLLDENPAEPTAIVFEMAKRHVMELIHNDTPELIFAKKAVVSCQDLLESINTALEEKSKETYECQCLDCNKTIKSTKHCKDINCPSCGGKMRRKDRPGSGDSSSKEKINSNSDSQNVVNENKVEVKESIIDKDFEEGGNQIMADEKKKDEVVEEIKSPVEEVVEEKTEETEESTKKSQEEVVEEKAEEVVEDTEKPDNYKVVTEENKITTETTDENSDTIEINTDTKQTISNNDEVISEVTSEVSEKTTFTFAEVEKIKAEYEAQIESLKASFEAEIEMAKEAAVKIEKLQAELGDYVKDFSDEDFSNEDKVENARLKKENDELKSASPVSEKTEEIEESTVETASLETGHEETPESKGSALVNVLKRKNKK